ncbi:MAG: phosphoribosylglycinamide formyltransferase [Candidatus Methylacidiphilales bacterium]
MKHLRIAVLGSGKGSNFIALHQAVVKRELPIDIVRVAGDVPDSGILTYAESHRLPTYLIPSGMFRTRLDAQVETELASLLLRDGTECVVLAGYMRVIKAPLLNAFPGRILNIHPSLLPDFKGLAAWKQALDAQVSETGCTVHWVDDSLDGGPIIAQRKVPVLSEDTADTLHARIQIEEHRLLPDVLEQIANGTISLPATMRSS